MSLAREIVSFHPDEPPDDRGGSGTQIGGRTEQEEEGNQISLKPIATIKGSGIIETEVKCQL